jgi:TonB family protein
MAAAGYQLKSELARVCLPAPARTARRRLAWANSICFLFLLIGVTGAQTRLPPAQSVPPLQQAVPVIVEPLPPEAQPAAEPKPTEQQNEDDKPDVPRLVAVTLETPAINFAVPTPGNLIVPMSVAPTPPVAPLHKAAPVRHEPATIQSTGNGGDRPAPYPYPPIALRLSQQGTVSLLLTVDDVGKVVSAEIQETSGSIILDRSAQEWVKRRWTIPPVNGAHLFLAPIHYVLKSG